MNNEGQVGVIIEPDHENMCLHVIDAETNTRTGYMLALASLGSNNVQVVPETDEYKALAQQCYVYLSALKTATEVPKDDHPDGR